MEGQIVEGSRIIGKGSSGCLPLHFVCMRG